MKVKICGITNEEYASDAVSLEADYLGFNFYKKGPRFITKEKAKKIIEKLPKKIKKVGVFVNEPIKKIEEISRYCNLDMIQLHGNENNHYLKNLKKIIKDKKIIKACRIKNRLSINKIKAINTDFILLDAYKKGLYGGTGKTFNLNLIKNIKNKKIFLSGGLNLDNIEKTIDIAKPYAVDVCSGVEKSKGKKDYEKMKLFIKRAKK